MCACFFCVQPDFKGINTTIIWPRHFFQTNRVPKIAYFASKEARIVDDRREFARSNGFVEAVAQQKFVAASVGGLEGG